MTISRRTFLKTASIATAGIVAVANIMVTAALRTRKFVTFDPNTHEVMAGDDVFHY
jgi:hypothetical protein